MALRLSIFAVLIAAVTAAAAAQANYPDHTIKIIVPLAPGGTADILPRILGERLSARWHQPVIIENKPGGGQLIGTQEVARAEPDGYTLLSSASGPLVVNPSLYQKLSYDPAAFAPVTVMAALPYVLEVNPKLPVATVAELVAYAKANPDKLNYAAPGGGSQTQLAVEWLKVLSGTRMTFVPYKGSAPAVTDLIAGHVDLMFDTPTTSLPLHQEGKIKILATGTPERMAEAPDIPTIAETVPGYRAVTWYAMVAPPQTPAAIADKINHDVVAILERKDVAEKVRAIQMDPATKTRAQAAQFFAEEAQLWGNVIKAANIPLQ
jgi:tripartite-type tricarboxylate transporter receptor subunit TctC